VSYIRSISATVKFALQLSVQTPNLKCHQNPLNSPYENRQTSDLASPSIYVLRAKCTLKRDLRQQLQLTRTKNSRRLSSPKWPKVRTVLPVEVWLYVTLSATVWHTISVEFIKW